jgi:hypothetical protein
MRNKLHCCLLDSSGSSYCGLYISAIMARMATKTCRVMCKDMMDMLDKGFGDLDSGLARNVNAKHNGTTAMAEEQSTRRR